MDLNSYESTISRRNSRDFSCHLHPLPITVSNGALSSEAPYHYGYQVCALVESDYAKQYREKHREQCKAWYERKKAEQLAQSVPAPDRKKPVRKPKFTEEERKERNRQRSLEYYSIRD